MKTIKISIPDMISTHCQMRVQTVLLKIEELKLQSISSASATITVPDNDIEQEAIEAIEQAGYQVAGIETAGSDSAGETLKFKTNINCGGCVAKVTPVLDAKEGITAWKVDTTDKDKILSVNAHGITADEVIETIKQTGFKIESM